MLHQCLALNVRLPLHAALQGVAGCPLSKTALVGIQGHSCNPPSLCDELVMRTW